MHVEKGGQVAQVVQVPECIGETRAAQVDERGDIGGIGVTQVHGSRR